MKKVILSLLIIFATLPTYAETGIVYDWGSGFRIQTRPDAKLSQQDKEWIEGNFKAIEKEMSRRRAVIKEFYGCCNNNGGNACNKILLKY